MATTPKPKKKAKKKPSVKKPTSRVTRNVPGIGNFQFAGGPLTRRAQELSIAQIQPGLTSLQTRGEQESSANRARQGDILNWHAFQQEQLNKSFGETTNALNNLITLQQQGGQGSQDALAAALRQGGTAQEALAKQLGGAPPPSQEQQLLAAAAAQQGVHRGALGSQAASTIGAAGDRRGVASLGIGVAQDAERRRFAALQRELEAEKQGLVGQIPGLVQQNLTGLRGERMARDQQKLAERVARQEYGLKTRQQDEVERSGRVERSLARRAQKLAEDTFTHTVKIDWERIGIDKTVAAAQLKQITNTQGEDAGKRLAGGWEILGSYLQGIDEGNTKREEAAAKAGTAAPARVHPKLEDAMRKLMGPGGLNEDQALAILAESPYETWRKAAISRLRGKGKTVAQIVFGGKNPAKKNPLKKGGKKKSKKKDKKNVYSQSPGLGS